MKLDQRKWGIALRMALILLAFQAVRTGGTPGRGKSLAVAAAEPEDAASIAVSGPVTVNQALVMSEVTVTDVTKDSLTYQWEEVPNATGYHIYQYDSLAEQYVYLTSTTATSYALGGLTAGEEYFLAVYAVDQATDSRSDLAALVGAYTKPEKVEAFTVTDNTVFGITLSWEDLPSATGYTIWRAGTGGDFKKIGSTEYDEYQDDTVEPGTTYQYKVISYAGTEDNAGEESPAVFTSSLPISPTVSTRAGDERIRLTWDAVPGASGYCVYTYKEDKFVLLKKLEGKSSKVFLDTDLENGETYQYYVSAYRTYENTVYESSPSDIATASAVEVGPTSMTPRLFKTKGSFRKSSAYTKCTDFRKKTKYSKNFAIPGMICTNVAGFSSSTMIPQGITYAKGYFFITAYDSKGIDNSVIYVVKRSGKRLMTTVALPNKTHAGGIAFDGKNLWITQAQTLRSIPYSDISAAIAEERDFVEVSAYGSEVDLPRQAATVTYYKKRLWVSSYDELNPGHLVSYKITDKSGTPDLTVLNTIRMPTRVQGISFTSNGRLIVSRSCQTNARQRGFMHQLDVYKPNLKKASQGKITLGTVRNSINMPTMNEEIAVSGNCLYIVFESVSFPTAVMRMDRVCTMPVSFLTKLRR